MLEMHKIQGDDGVKINKIGFKVILIMMLIVMCNSCIAYAANNDPMQSILKDDSSGSGASNQTPATNSENKTVQGNDNLGLPNLDSSYKPTISTGDTTLGIISKLLGVLQVLGVIAIVVSIAIMGFGSILGSAGEKAAGQEKMVGIVVAAALITGGSIIAKLLISFAENI